MWPKQLVALQADGGNLPDMGDGWMAQNHCVFNSSLKGVFLKALEHLSAQEHNRYSFLLRRQRNPAQKSEMLNTPANRPHPPHCLASRGGVASSCGDERLRDTRIGSNTFD